MSQLGEPGRIDDDEEPSHWAGAMRPHDEPLVRLGVIGGERSSSAGGGGASVRSDDSFEYVDASGSVPAARDAAGGSDTQRLVDVRDDDDEATASSDDQVLFDNRSSRLQLADDPTGRRRRRVGGGMLSHAGAAEGRRVLFCRALLVALAYFAVGMCTALIGPTLPDLQAFTGGRNGSITTIVGVVGVAGSGRLVGAAFGGALLQCLSVFCAVPVCLMLAAGCTLGIPFASSLTPLLSLAFVQGVFLAAVERGGYAAYAQHWRRRRARVLHVFYVAMAAGATLAPLMTTPLLKNSLGKYADDSFATVRPEPHAVLRRAAAEEQFAMPVDNGTSAYQNNTEIFMNSTVAPAVVHTKPPVAQNSHNREMSPGATKVKVAEEAALKHKAAAVPAAPTSKLFSPDASSEDSAERDSGSAQNNDSAATSSTSTNPTTTTTMTSSTSATTTTASLAPSATHGGDEHTDNAATTGSTEADNTSGPVTPTGITDTIAKKDTSWRAHSASVLWRWRAAVRTALARMHSFDTVKLAYVFAALATAAAAGTYALICCCCVPCATLQRRPPTGGGGGGAHVDPTGRRIRGSLASSLLRLCSQSESGTVLALACLYAALLTCVESVLANLLTSYYLTRSDALPAADVRAEATRQQTGALLTAVYWAAATVGRLASLAADPCCSQWSLISTQVLAASLCTGLAAIFAPHSETMLWLCVAGMGALLSPSYAHSFTWLDEQLSLSPTFASVWLCTSRLGHCIGPWLVAAAMATQRSHVLLLAVLCSTVAAGIVLAALRRAIAAAAPLLAADDINRVRKRPGEPGAEYTRIQFDAANETVDLDLELDDDDDNDGDTLPPAGRSAHATAAAPGALFDQYVSRSSLA